MNLKAEIFRISISHYVEIVLLFLYLQYFAGDVAQVGYQGVVMLTLWMTFFCKNPSFILEFVSNEPYFAFNVLLSNKAPGFLNQFAVQSLHMTIFRGIYVFVCLLKHLINDP